MNIGNLLRGVIDKEVFVERVRAEDGSSSISGALTGKVSKVGDDYVVLEVYDKEYCIPFHAILLITPGGTEQDSEQKFKSEKRKGKVLVG